MTKSEDKLDATMRVLKTGTCPTLSGKSKLTYHVGCNPESVIHIRIFSNLGSGNFSKEWIALEDIQTTLDKRRKGSPVTAYLLQPLFKGKSVNTPAFLLAALANEKLVRALKGKKREHEILDPAGFISKVEKLIASGVVVKVKTPVRKTAAKTAIETPIKKTTTKKATVKKTAGKTVGKTAGRTIRKAHTKKAAIKKLSTARRKQTKTS
jgi:hypothetical protein